MLRHPHGWCADARLGADAEVAVAAGHPWCGRPGVETLPDRASLEAEAIAEIARACTPIIEVLATRSRRGRAGLWAQIADSVGGAAHSLHDAEPQIPTDTVIGATEQLLHAPGAPWKQTPDFWLADADDNARDVLVVRCRLDHGAFLVGVVHDPADVPEHWTEDRQADRLVALRRRHEHRS